jgi:hypothetical protein
VAVFKITICDFERSWAAIQQRLLGAAGDVVDRHECSLVCHVHSQVRGCLAVCGVPLSVGILKYDRITPTECAQNVTSAANFVRV